MHLYVCQWNQPGKVSAYLGVSWTSSHRMPYKPATFLLGRPIGECLYTHSDFCVFYRKTCKHATPSWRLMCIYTPSFLGVPGVTVGWSRTKGTASNEQVHSFCGYLPNPFIQDLCLWHTCQDFISIVMRPLISLWNAVCSTGRWSIIGRCFGACQWSSCAEERRPQ